MSCRIKRTMPSSFAGPLIPSASAFFPSCLSPRPSSLSFLTLLPLLTPSCPASQHYSPLPCPRSLTSSCPTSQLHYLPTCLPTLLPPASSCRASPQPHSLLPCPTSFTSSLAPKPHLFLPCLTPATLPPVLPHPQQCERVSLGWRECKCEEWLV